MTKIECTKAQLISNMQTVISQWQAELYSVKCEMETITLGRPVMELDKTNRDHYRALVVYRDDVQAYIETLKLDLVTAQRWTIDTFRYYLINDTVTQQWLGWN